MAGPTDKQTDQLEQDDAPDITSDTPKDDLYPGAPDDSDGDDMEVDEHEDGSATVRIKNKANDVGETKWFDNLAKKLDEDERRTLAVKLLDLTDYDKRAAENRDKMYQKGLQSTGASVDAPGGAQFAGASRATHPLLLECSIDASASIIKELLPANGPCKTKTYGDQADPKELDRANRIRDYMNWQCTEEIEEYGEVLDETISQVPLAGSQYEKWWWDKALGRPRIEYISSDDMFLPGTESSFWNSRRKTHRQYLSREVVEERMASGHYMEIDLIAPPMIPDKSKAEEANAKIEGTNKDAGFNEDGVRVVYDYYIYWKFEQWGDKAPMPYIITVDETQRDIFQVQRNWEETDEHHSAMDWIVEFPFIKWRGPYTLGFNQVIGSLSDAATGALRALLDSAHINNSASGVKLKGARFGGQSQQPDVGQISELQASANVDDIRKLFMPLPFNPPSPMLFQLLGFLVDGAKGIVRAAEETSDTSPNAPVGTTLANIEQGAKVFSSIHARLHKAQGKSLKILYRLNRMYLTKERVVEELGKLAVRPEDFDAPSPIVPVSDPNIFSEAQRFAQMQGVHQLATMWPDKYNLDELNERTLQLMRIPDYEGLLTKKPDPKEQNPVAENLQMAYGQPAFAFPLQDHFAHIQAHLLFITDPTYGQNPIIAPKLLPAALDHIAQHLVLAYARMMYEAANQAAGKPVDEYMSQKDPETRAAFDQMMAAVGQVVQKQSTAAFEKVGPALQQAFAMMKQMQPPQPMDPSAVAQQDVQRQTQKDQMDAQLKAKQQEQDQQETVVNLQEKRAELQAKTQMDAAKLATQQKKDQQQAAIDEEQAAIEERARAAQTNADLMMNHEDNQTALTIAAARAVDADEKVGNLKDGSSLTNPES